MNDNYNYDRDDLESSLRYVVSEYGVESLIGKGKTEASAVLLMHDYFNARFHDKEYNLLKKMEQLGIMRIIVELKDSASDEADCVSGLNNCVKILNENFISTDIAEKFVNIIASVAGLNARANVSAKSSESVSSVTPPPKAGTITAPKPEPLQPEPTVQETPPVQKPKPAPMSDYDFVELCKSGDAAKVEEAIINGANVNAKDKDGYTGLMWTTMKWKPMKGLTKVAKVLVEHGAKIKP